jgi:hypothetical protein
VKVELEICPYLLGIVDFSGSLQMGPFFRPIFFLKFEDKNKVMELVTCMYVVRCARCE